MKIYTASFFEPENWRGEIFSIARRMPTGVGAKRLPIFAPPARLLRRYKKRLIDEDEYAEEYLISLETKIGHFPIFAITNIFKDMPKEVTLLCRERAGEFCHRNILADFLKSIGFEIYKDTERK